MRTLVQRVRSASVSIDATQVSSINEGLLVLVGIHTLDTPETVRWMANKLVNLRIFPDADDKMNLSLRDTNRELLIVSNFTLYGDCSKGTRPSFIESARPESAEPLYEELLTYLRSDFGIEVKSGVFGAMMDVALVNWGPVTLLLEKNSRS